MSHPHNRAGFVVSINVDTLYASFYLDLSQGPQIFTIPRTNVTYSLYIQTTPPARALRPNWLPVPRRPFDLLLRVYGPEGNTSPGAEYIPPGIQP